MRAATREPAQLRALETALVAIKLGAACACASWLVPVYFAHAPDFIAHAPRFALAFTSRTSAHTL